MQSSLWHLGVSWNMVRSQLLGTSHSKTWIYSYRYFLSKKCNMTPQLKPFSNILYLSICPIVHLDLSRLYCFFVEKFSSSAVLDFLATSAHSGAAKEMPESTAWSKEPNKQTKRQNKPTYQPRRLLPWRLVCLSNCFVLWGFWFGLMFHLPFSCVCLGVGEVS